MSATLDRILGLYDSERANATLGEVVTQRAHALQSAWLAERAGAAPTLVAAALLHDIGHLFHDTGQAAGGARPDDRHEELGWRVLARSFPPEVAMPVRLHVAAKRYLCATESGYGSVLSEASLRSLSAQGGALALEQVRAFESEPFRADAVRLRRWDDRAKVPGLPTPGFDHFVPFLEAALGP